MTHAVAELRQNPTTNKWEAVYRGEVLASSMSQSYVIENIRTGRCNKANKVGVRDVVIPQGSPLSHVGQAMEVAQQGLEVDKFSIDERFSFLTGFVKMVADREAPSLICSGDGGLGKTWTITDTLHNMGIQNCDDVEEGLKPGPDGDGKNGTIKPSESKKWYKMVKGYSTAKGVYRTLYENRNRIVIFDDCDQALRDPTALNLMKAALDSYDKRVVSWHAESLRDDGLPQSFTFTGGVIFITNMPLFRLDKAVKTRAIPVDLSMSTDQKIERMETIVKSDKFLPSYSDEAKRMALDLIRELKDTNLPEISFRSLITTTRIAARGEEDWKKRAEYYLRQGF